MTGLSVYESKSLASLDDLGVYMLSNHVA